jgi:hypothetical protein
MLLVCLLSDILNENREINKLEYKTNWIAAFTCLIKNNTYRMFSYITRSNSFKYILYSYLMGVDAIDQTI